MRDVQELFSWDLGPDFAEIDLGGGSIRPSRMGAIFTIGGTIVEVAAEGSRSGVRIQQVAFRPKPDQEALARAMMDRGGTHPRTLEWLRLESAGDLNVKEMAAFDKAAAEMALERAAVITYELEDGRPAMVRLGPGTPAVPTSVLRRRTPGPKKKSLAGFADAYNLAAGDLKILADDLGISLRTAQRYAKQARDAGLIKEA